ncbi:MAG: tetratricopeptide repeat protein, partial [Saprospiraceae bacterium]|nr:tetratricopeptide repeat protein [Saprospiraceae bacterium]
MRLSSYLPVLLSLLFMPVFAGAQVLNALNDEATRLLHNLESADTSLRKIENRKQYELADTAIAAELAQKSVVWTYGRKYTESREAAEKATGIYAQLGIENEKALFAWDALTKVCYFTENYSRALEACEVSAAICRKFYPETHPRVLRAYNDLGVLYTQAADYDQALGHLSKALELNLQLPDVCASNILSLYKNIGTLYMYKAQYAKGLENYEKEYQIAVQCSLEGTPAMLGVYLDLAAGYTALGDLYQPIEMLKKGAAIAERHEGSVNLEMVKDIIICFDHLGHAYSAVYQLDKATHAHEKALNLKLKYWPTNYISISDSYNSLAYIRQRSGDYKNAARYHEKAIETLSRSPQGSPEKLAYYYGNLAFDLHHLGDLQRAIEIQEHALNLKISAFGPAHPAVTGSYHNLAAALSETGEYEQALHYSHLAISTFIQANTENHPDVVKFYMRAGEIYARMSNSPKATEYYHRALEICTQVYQEAHPDMATIFYNLGKLYAPGDDPEAAAGLVRQGMKINSGFFGPQSAPLAAGYTILGNVYQKAGRHAEAEQAFRSALDALGTGNAGSLDNLNTLEQQIGTHAVVGKYYQNQYRQTHETTLLTKSRDHYAQALAALNRLSRSVSPASKSTLAAQAADICAGGIATDLLLHNPSDSLHAFDLAERSKAYVLFEAMKDADALHIAGIPDSLLERERDLRLEIAFFEKRQQELR